MKTAVVSVIAASALSAVVARLIGDRTAAGPGD